MSFILRSVSNRVTSEGKRHVLVPEAEAKLRELGDLMVENISIAHHVAAGADSGNPCSDRRTLSCRSRSGNGRE